MATYYWVGGSGTWNSSNTANWATTTGGTPGAGPPTSADTVNFDGNSGTAATVTVASTAAGNNTTINKSDINLSLSGNASIAAGTNNTLTLTAGTLTLNTYTLTCNAFSSSNLNTRTIAFGTGNITVTGSGTSWTTTTVTGLSTSGTQVVNFTYSAAFAMTVASGALSEANSISFNFKAGTYSLTFLGTAGNTARDVDFTGFAGTWAATAACTIYGSLKLATGMTLTASTSAITFGATSGTKNITSNGKTMDFPITFSGVGGTWALQDAMTMGSTRTCTLSNGTLSLGSNTLTTGLFNASGTTTRTIDFGTGNITVTSTGTVWTTATVTGLTVSGTPIVNVTNATATAATVNSGALSEANSISFNFTAGTYSLTFLGVAGYTARNVDFTGFAGTWAATGACTIYGNLKLATGMTLTASASAMTFGATSGTQKITSNGRTMDFPITFNGVGGTFQLQDAMTVGSTRTTTLTNGTLDLLASTLTTGTFNSNNSNTRTIAFGTGNITVISSGTIWTTATVTGLTVSGTPIVNVNNATANPATISSGALSEANSISFNFTSGTYVLTFMGSSGSARSVDFTGFSGTWGAFTAACTIYGDLKLSTGMTLSASSFTMTFGSTSATQNITSNGKTIDFPITFNGTGSTFKPQDAMTVGSTRTTTLTTGTIDLSLASLSTGLFVATGSTARTIAFSTGTISVTGNNGTVINIGGTNFSYTGTMAINSTYTGATGTRTFTADLIAAGTYPTLATSGGQINIGTTATDIVALTGSWGNIDFTGYTQTLANSARSLYGDLKLASGMTLTGGANATTFAATSGTKKITSSGKTMDFPITFDGIGGTVQLQDAMTVGSTRTTTHTNGTIDLNGQTLNVGASYTTAAGTKNITFNGGTLVCPAVTATAFNNAAPTNFTTTAGTGTGKISMTGATAKTFVGGGSTYNCTLSNDGAGALTITDSNTFTTLANGVQPTTFTFTSGTTTTLTNWSISGTAGNLVTINSTTTAQHTLSKASGTVSANYLSLKYSNAAGGATWNAGANSTNAGFNNGWILVSTWYWVGGTGTWDNSNTANWAVASLGTGGAGVPLNTDTVYFDTNSGTGTITVASTAVAAATTVNSGTISLSLSGNATLSTGTNALTLTTGTLTLNSYTLTCGTFSSSNSLTRAIDFGTGNLTVTGTGTVWTTSNVNSLTISGTPIVNVTNSTATAATVITGPLAEANSISFNFTAGTYSLTFLGTAGNAVKNVDFTGFAGTWAATSTCTIYGDLKLSSGMALTASTSAMTFAATSGTKKITSNGKTMDFPITFNGVGGTWQLQDAMTVGSTQTTTLTNGTLDLSTNTLTTGIFLASNLNTRTIAFGTGNITVSGVGTVWSTSTSSGLTFTGTPTVNVTNSTATATTVASGGLTEANNLDFNFTAGTYSLTFLGTAGYTARNVDFTGFAGTWAAIASCTIYGDLKLSTGMTLATSSSTLTFGATSGTQKITSNGKAMDFAITFNGVGGTFQLQDAMTVGSTRTTTLTNGTLDLLASTLTTGTFASSNSNTRTLAFGTGSISVASAWNTGTVTNLTVSGAPIVNVTNSTATASTISSGALSEANSISFNFTAGTYSLTFLGTAGYTARNVDFTGFAGSWVTTSTCTIYGDLKLSTGMTLTASANAMTFAATSGTQNITSNGKTMDFPLTIDGAGGTFKLIDALTQGTSRAFTHTNGTLNLNGKTLTVGVYTTAAGTKNITFDGGTLVCPANSVTAFNNAAPTNFTTTAGTGTGKISMTNALAKTFVGGGSTYNCTLSNDGAGALTITDSNTFTTLANGVQPTTFTFTAGTTTTVTNWSVSGTSGNLVTIGSATAASHTLNKTTESVSANYLSISRSTTTGGAVWNAGANSTNGGNNSGWVFGTDKFSWFF